MTLEELLAEATPGPWDASTDGLVVQMPEHLAQPPVAVCDRWQDGYLIALAPDLARLALDMGEALRSGPRCPVHGIPDCSPLLNGCSLPNRIAAILARLDGLVAGKDRTQ